MIELIILTIAIIARHYNVVNEEIYHLILKAFIFSIPILTFIGWFAFRIYVREEIIRRNNLVMNKFQTENIVHIMALLESDKERFIKMNPSDEFRKELTKAWLGQYRIKLMRELHEVFPKKTQPQINKLLDDFLKIES